MSATPENCFHLTVEIVREIHQSAIRDFGGSDGIRENALLESATLVTSPNLVPPASSPASLAGPTKRRLFRKSSPPKPQSFWVGANPSFYPKAYLADTAPDVVKMDETSSPRLELSATKWFLTSKSSPHFPRAWRNF